MSGRYIVLFVVGCQPTPAPGPTPHAPAGGAPSVTASALPAPSAQKPPPVDLAALREVRRGEVLRDLVQLNHKARLYPTKERAAARAEFEFGSGRVAWGVHEVIADHGASVEVKPVRVKGCGHDSGSRDYAYFVNKNDLMVVNRRVIEQSFEDGTSIRYAPGHRITSDDGTNWVLPEHPSVRKAIALDHGSPDDLGLSFEDDRFSPYSPQMTTWGSAPDNVVYLDRRSPFRVGGERFYYKSFCHSVPVKNWKNTDKGALATVQDFCFVVIGLSEREPASEARPPEGACRGGSSDDIGGGSGSGGGGVTQYSVKSQDAVWMSGESAGKLEYSFEETDPPTLHGGRHCWRVLANAAEKLCFSGVVAKKAKPSR